MAELSKQYVADLHLQFLIVVCEFSNLFHNCGYPLSEGILSLYTQTLSQVEATYISALRGG